MSSADVCAQQRRRLFPGLFPAYFQVKVATLAPGSV
jgi:hypothetical protein